MRSTERVFRPILALAALAALAGTAPIHAATPPDPWAPVDYRIQADQNRYLVKAADMVQLAPNMEPVMQHTNQIQETIDKLQGKGFCAAALARSCPTCKIDPNKEKSCKKPNILVFLVDDMGWADFGAYGGGITYGAATPMVDQLAKEGLILTSTYSQPTCSPSRATIHTGQLPVHHGVLYPPMYGDPGGLTEASITLPWLLQKQGYRTQGVGKWHMGENVPNLPANVGYDDYYGFLSVSDMYTEWRDQYYNPEVVRDEVRTTYMDNNRFSHYLIHDTPQKGCEALAEITLPWEAKTANEENRKRIANGEPPVSNRGNANNCTPPKSNWEKVSIADLDKLWAEYSDKFIRGMEGKNQPWFLYHATRGCHFDNYPQVGDRRVSYARTLYSDCTVEMDEILGVLVRALRESGQAESTLVFFSSDNGPEDEIPPHGHTPFRGGKGDTWEGGVRGPGIAWWPGMIEPRTSDGLFDQADLYTTALTLAGFDYAAPADPALAKDLGRRYLYGIDQSSFLLSKDGQSNRRSVLHWYLTNFASVRMDELKAHRVITEPLGLSQGYPGGLSGVNLEVSYLWMFNLQEDPKEQNNINIRHLWAQHLFSNEFGRFLCVLTDYPPHLPTQPEQELSFRAEIEMLRTHPQKYKETCGKFPKPWRKKA